MSCIFSWQNFIYFYQEEMPYQVKYSPNFPIFSQIERVPFAEGTLRPFSMVCPLLRPPQVRTKKKIT